MNTTHHNTPPSAQDARGGVLIETLTLLVVIAAGMAAGWLVMAAY